MTQFCCPGFENGAENDADRGLFISVAEFEGEPQFRIAFRSTHKLDRELAREILSKSGTPSILLSACTGMQYCPWCGANLKQYYANSWQEWYNAEIDRELDIY